MNERYHNICVRVDSDKTLGSGFLIKSPENYYIITAFHCVGNKENMKLFDNIYVWSNKDKEKVSFIFRKDKIKFFPNSTDDKVNIDLAIIPIDKKVKVNGREENIEDINNYGGNSLIIEQNLNSRTSLKLVGFPEYMRDKDNIDLELEALEVKNYRTNSEVGKFSETDFKHSGGQTLDEKLDGFSGAGIFGEVGNLFILKGIFVKYKDDKDLGGAISSTKLLELFKYSQLELPYNEDGYLLEMMNNTLKAILQQLEKKDPTSEIEEIEKEIKGSLKKISLMIKSLTEEERFINRDEYVKIVLEHLCLLQYFENQFKIKEDRISIEINDSFLSKVFKSRYKDDLTLIKVELNKFINEKKFKIEDLEHIYVEGIYNLDSSPFQCEKCPYYSNVPEAIRDKVEKGMLPEDILDDFMNSDNSSDLLEGRKPKNIRIKCAECISIGKLDRLDDRKEKLWG